MNQEQKISLARRSSSQYAALFFLSRSRRNAVAIVFITLSFVVLFALNRDDEKSDQTTLLQKQSESTDALRKAIQDDNFVATEKHTKTNLVDPEAKNVSYIVLLYSNGCVFISSFCLMFSCLENNTVYSCCPFSVVVPNCSSHHIEFRE